MFDLERILYVRRGVVQNLHYIYAHLISQTFAADF